MKLEWAVAPEPDFAPALAQAAGCHSQILTNNWSDDPALHRRLGVDMANAATNAAATTFCKHLPCWRTTVQPQNSTVTPSAPSPSAGALDDPQHPWFAYAWYMPHQIWCA